MSSVDTVGCSDELCGYCWMIRDKVWLRLTWQVVARFIRFNGVLLDWIWDVLSRVDNITVTIRGVSVPNNPVAIRGVSVPTNPVATNPVAIRAV